ncbi:sugar transporter [Silvimonas amylolytica]|uniref:Sugar transporter n=2 Tax=Silvimonas amylolytica TaxID=449663 RepID=A0ABQ2PI61_9NEIS|nr:sugar transporter [Silvimonas amylolytica]
MDERGKKAFYAAWAGWGVDAYDFVTFSFIVVTLINLWGIGREEAGLLGTVTLLFSSLGGWIAGILADRYGRTKLLQGTIIWFSICTVGIGFAQDFTQFFILRALQGLGFGGEWAVGAVLVAESVAPKNRGKTVGIMQSGWAIGWGMAAILYSLVYLVLPEDLAWRCMFWLGAIPSLLVLYIRRNVVEPEVFVQTKAAKEQAQLRTSALTIFSAPLLRTTLLATLFCTGMQGGYYATSIWLPMFLKTERHLSVLSTGEYLLVVILGSFLGYVCGAYLADYWGRRRNFVVFSTLSAASTILYTTLPLSNTQILLLGFPLGFTISGIFAGVGAYLSELFPSEHRANGQSFSYSFGRGIGALFPGLVGLLGDKLSLSSSIAIFGAAAYGAVLVAVILLHENKGQPFE